jgi:hypothetical protein
MAITATGNEVVLKDRHGRVMRLAVKELLLSDRAQVIPDGPGPSSVDDEDLASVVLAQLSNGQRDALLEKAAHIRELLTGYRSGSPEIAEEGEPRGSEVGTGTDPGWRPVPGGSRPPPARRAARQRAAQPREPDAEVGQRRGEGGAEPVRADGGQLPVGRDRLHGDRQSAATASTVTGRASAGRSAWLSTTLRSVGPFRDRFRIGTWPEVARMGSWQRRQARPWDGAVPARS